MTKSNIGMIESPKARELRRRFSMEGIIVGTGLDALGAHGGGHHGGGHGGGHHRGGAWRYPGWYGVPNPYGPYAYLLYEETEDMYTPPLEILGATRVGDDATTSQGGSWLTRATDWVKSKFGGSSTAGDMSGGSYTDEPTVLAVQKAILDLQQATGDPKLSLAPYGADGAWGPTTAAAVARVNEINGHPEWGQKITDGTLAALMLPPHVAAQPAPKARQPAAKAAAAASQPPLPPNMVDVHAKKDGGDGMSTEGYVAIGLMGVGALGIIAALFMGRNK